MRICVIFNPAARGERARRFRRQIDRLGSDCILEPTWAPGAGRLLAAQAVRDSFDTIVAAGGDGTMNEVLNGIGDVQDGFARVRLGVLPLGTVNVFAKEYVLPTRFLDAWDIIKSGKERLIDLPEVEFGPAEKRQYRFFAQMAGAGFDARAVELVDWELKRKIGYFAYVAAVCRAFRSQPSQITLTHGKETVTGELVLIGNGRFYAGRFVAFPLAKADDGLLDVCVFSRADWLTSIRCLPRLLLRKIHRQPGIQYSQSDALSLGGTGPVPLQLDGELAGQLPATFSIRKQALRLIVP
ncbi:MAG: diacylglycerol kinase family lipid kinase [Candidatus Omnitrophica bacterium]|nr:diacylglycerol kinase family lipid kinase [Candidatus Omnitrophota bacterium]